MPESEYTPVEGVEDVVIDETNRQILTTREGRRNSITRYLKDFQPIQPVKKENQKLLRKLSKVGPPFLWLKDIPQDRDFLSLLACYTLPLYPKVHNIYSAYRLTQVAFGRDTTFKSLESMVVPVNFITIGFYEPEHRQKADLVGQFLGACRSRHDRRAVVISSPESDDSVFQSIHAFMYRFGSIIKYDSPSGTLKRVHERPAPQNIQPFNINYNDGSPSYSPKKNETPPNRKAIVDNEGVKRPVKKKRTDPGIL